ncbi:ImmA/IrrE family metallo-endopeptidase [Candidatus Omnitrophota bacterium]
MKKVPIPDFRTVGNEIFRHPSPDLLDTIYICQQRQEWYREYMRVSGGEPLEFVGIATAKDNVEEFAVRIRSALKFDIEERRKMSTWTDALRSFIEQAEQLGILVMVNGVVGNNNWRKLDPHEFRGFALTDNLAPLIFINNADTKSAKMFTLAHELVHIWIGQSALSDAQVTQITGNQIERWCNAVAAELLVPLAILREEYQKNKHLSDEVNRLARYFKVSTLVILRRIYDAKGLQKEQFWKAYNDEIERLLKIPTKEGGNFYLTQPTRLSRRFAKALISNTLEGQTLYRNALHLLGFSKVSTFQDLGQSLGVV